MSDTPDNDTEPVEPRSPLGKPPPLGKPSGPKLVETPQKVKDNTPPFYIKWLGKPFSPLSILIITILACLTDFCLYQAVGGMGAAVLGVAAIAGLAAANYKDIKKLNLLIAGLLLMVVLMMAWRVWWLQHIVFWIGIFLLSIKLHCPKWNMPVSLMAIGQTLMHAPFKILGLFYSLITLGRSKKSDQPTKKPRITLLRLIVPLMVCFVFFCVFAMANPVLQQWTDKVWFAFANWVEELDLLKEIPRVFVWFLWLFAFALIFNPTVGGKLLELLAARSDKLQEPKKVTENSDTYWMSFLTLIGVNIMFLAYNIMDAVYLYFKATLPKGMNFTEYTHSGCGWLTFALFLSSVVTGVIFRNELNFHARGQQLKKLAYIWVGLNGILAIGTIRRIAMYIDYSGLTHLRITGIYGSLLVMTGLIVMLIKVRRNHNAVWLLRRYTASFLIAIGILAITPNEWICANYNVQNVLDGTPRAMRPLLLKEISPAAMPSLIPLLDYNNPDGHDEITKQVREGSAAMLMVALGKLEAELTDPWSKRQLSKQRAYKALKPLEEKLLKIVPEEKRYEAINSLKSNYDLNPPPPRPRGRGYLR